MRIMGWRFEGTFPDSAKLVAIVAPHTSNWDFVVGFSALLAIGVEVHWLGKHTIFSGPWGAIWKRHGGIPVDRASSHDVVSQIVDEFRNRDSMVLALSPEGTRRKVLRWKSGFWHIAVGARVPIVPVALDYRTRSVQLMPPFIPTGDSEPDIAALRARFSGVVARRPENV
ncbi:MAG: hypothetical protein JWO05_2476 [Gemmatimonadetes bacterium]|nr:hypothetical protein [Gemmatimonadota bacterium]